MLDLSTVTSGAYYGSDAHYRHYLSQDGVPVVICVQSGDYSDYDPGRFLSGVAFLDEDEAYATKIKRRQLRAVLADPDSREDWPLAMRNLQAASVHRRPVRDRAVHLIITDSDSDSDSYIFTGCCGINWRCLIETGLVTARRDLVTCPGRQR